MDISSLFSGFPLQEIYSQLMQEETESKKTAQTGRRISKEKLVRLTQEYIHHLRQQQRQMMRGAWYGFALGLLGTLAQGVNALAPGTMVVLRQAMTALGMATNLFGRWNPFALSAQGAQLKAEQVAGKARMEEGRVNFAQERIEGHKDHRRHLREVLERILQDQETAQEAALRR